MYDDSPSIRDQVWDAADPTGENRALVDAAVHGGQQVPVWLRRVRVDVDEAWTRLTVNAFYGLASTIGAFLVFPIAVCTDGKRPDSINQARGIHSRIGDRFDLTLEGIRHHYRGTVSPLADVLGGNGESFDLFGDFRGYVDHFLLNDMVSEDYGSVKLLTTFDGFAGDPLPAASVAEYRTYMSRSMDFVRARNERIHRYAVETP